LIGPGASNEQAEEIAKALQLEGIVVAFDNEPLRTLMHPGQVVAFCEAMVADMPTEQQKKLFGTLGITDSAQATWTKWLDNFEPNAFLLESMEEFIAKTRGLEYSIRDQIAAEERLQQFAYPLTIFGMLLGVGSFAHLIRWSKVGFLPESAQAAGSMRLTTLAMTMIGAMSMLDLAWTVMASQAGVMAEINPIAEYFISSATDLALFKVAFTGLGVGILYFARHRRVTQQATWMVCFVCTLLTFRWVVFDSML